MAITNLSNRDATALQLQERLLVQFLNHNISKKILKHYLTVTNVIKSEIAVTQHGYPNLNEKRRSQYKTMLYSVANDLDAYLTLVTDNQYDTIKFILKNTKDSINSLFFYDIFDSRFGNEWWLHLAEFITDLPDYVNHTPDFDGSPAARTLVALVEDWETQFVPLLTK